MQQGEPSDDGVEAPILTRAVEYVRMSTEHQQYSTENQADKIREYAARRGIEIVRTYADAGKSGLRMEGRVSLQQGCRLSLTGGVRSSYYQTMRLLLVFMLCVLPLQASWAAAAGYCGHEQGKAAQHFGHHDDEYRDFFEKNHSDKQSGKLDLGHDHCHMSSFLALPSVLVAHTPVLSSQSSLHCDERIHSSLVLARVERPKWHILA